MNPVRLLALSFGLYLGSALGTARAQAPAPEARPITVTIRARVVDARNQPLPGVAAVTPLSVGWTTAEVSSKPTVKTAADGRLEVAHGSDAKGQRMLVLAAPGKVTTTVSTMPMAVGGTIDNATIELGTIVMPDGVALGGKGWRIRARDGKPVAGARIEATDAMERGSRTAGRVASRSVTTSDAEGQFEIPGTFAEGVALYISCPGFISRRVPIANAGEPLVVELEASGFVTGRLLDADGKPAGAKSVYLDYESGRSGTRERTETEPDGTFRLSIDRPGPFRVQAYGGDAAGSGRSSLLTGTAERVEVRLDGRKGAPPCDLKVRALDMDGQPIKTFSAGTYWWQLPSGIDVAQMIGATRCDADGFVRLIAPKLVGVGRDPEPRVPVRVTAPGYAPCFIEEVERKEDTEVLVEARLKKESVLTGKVVDDASGEPIAGAVIVAMLAREVAQDPLSGRITSSRSSTDGPRSGTDGAFRVGDLGKGKYELQARHPARPDSATLKVELGDVETKGDLVLKMPAGLVLAGRLEGVKPGAGWKLKLVAEAQAAGGRVFTSMSGRDDDGADVIAVGSDGKFRFEGRTPGSYQIQLLIPGVPRSGERMSTQVDTLRLRKSETERVIDCGEDAPGTLRGKVQLTSARLPRGRLAIVATLASGNASFEMMVMARQGGLAGRRALIGADGSYELELVPGEHRLRVVDLLTGVVLGTARAKVAAASASTQDFALKVAPLRVSLKPQEGERYLASMLAVTCKPDDAEEEPNAGRVVVMGGSNSSLSEIGVDLADSPGEVTFLVPAGEVTLKVELGPRGSPRPQVETLGEAGVTVKAGEPATAAITVAPPPKSDEEKDREAEGKGRAK